MGHLLDLVISGAIAGSIVGLMALGLSLVYRTTGVLNLAQGSVAALGGYVCVSAASTMPMAAALALAVAVAAIVGALVGFGIQIRLSRHSMVIAMVATLAAGVLLSQIEQQVWGNLPIFPNVFGLQPVQALGLTLNRVDLWATLAAVALALGLTLYLWRTRLGLAMRAVADSIDGARVSGISPIRIQVASWAIASGLAAVAGFFIATPMGVLSPDFANIYMVAALIAAVIGGLGSLLGAVTGAVLVSVAQSLFASYAPTLTFGSKVVLLGSFTQTLILLLLIAVLLLLPRGLWGAAGERKV